METVELAAEIRETRPKSRVRGLRREGRIPAVLYGPKTKATAIAISGAELRARVSSSARQRLMRLKSSAPELNDRHVIVKDIQRAPVSGNFVHADFYEVDLTQPLRVEVPLRFVGKAVGIAEGGILQPLVREVEVECLPLEIPEVVEVDVTALNIHDVIHISAMSFAGNVKPIFDTDYAVVTVLPPTVAEAPVVAAEAAPAEGAEAAAAGAAPAAAAPAEAGGAKEAAKAAPKEGAAAGGAKKA
ncbi:MAG TPA: 50S ribosomal protein L25 [Candidatus Binataceae bacterium]|nr:50S ribosomal protein L25 [Candidatus Binataceae bacterium]